MQLYCYCLAWDQPETSTIHTDPEEGIGQAECSGKTASGPRSPATI